MKIFETQHKLSIGSFFVQIFYIIGLVILVNQPNSITLQAILLLMLILAISNCFINGLASLQNRFAKNAWQEANDTELNNKEQQIFSTETLEDDFHQAGYRRFRRFFIPFSISIISLIEFLSMFIIWQQKIGDKVTFSENDILLPTTSFCLFFAALFFLLSKYLGGLAYHNRHYFLRPIASGLFFNSLLLFLVALATLVGYLNIYFFANIILYILAITIGIISVERVILWVLDFYRPKVQKDDLPIYESRFFSLFSHSGGALHSLSDILQYQFGIQINENLISTFFKRYLVCAAFIQILIAFLLSSIVYIDSQSKGIEQNIITCQTKILDSGIYWRLPYPFVSVKRLPNNLVQRQIITHSKVKRTNNKGYQSWVIKRHHNSLQLGKDNQGNISLVSTEIALAYVIDDHQAFMTNNASPKKIIDLIVKQELNQYLATDDFNAIRKNYQPLLQYLKTRLKQRFIEQKLGINIQQLDITYFTPPATIAEYYQQYIIADNLTQSSYQTAQTEAFTLRSQAQDEAFSLISTAQDEAIIDKALYEEDGKYFLSKQLAFKNNPKLYKTIELMNLLEQNGKKSQVQEIIILSNKDKILNLDLKGFAPDFLFTK